MASITATDIITIIIRAGVWARRLCRAVSPVRDWRTPVTWTYARGWCTRGCSNVRRTNTRGIRRTRVLGSPNRQIREETKRKLSRNIRKIVLAVVTDGCARVHVLLLLKRVSTSPLANDAAAADYLVGGDARRAVRDVTRPAVEESFAPSAAAARHREKRRRHRWTPSTESKNAAAFTTP